jgi:ABC-type Fe3+-citrate transport system substrate-binding protein
MWIVIVISIVAIILLFTIGTNTKTSQHTKENKNVKDDVGLVDDE